MLRQAVVLGLVVGLAACGAPPAPPSEPAIRPAKLYTVAASDLGPSRSFPALVRAGDRADLSFRVSGRLIELPAEEGKEVPGGEVLARLDPRDFETRLAEARSNLAQGEADLAALRSGARAEEVALLDSQLASAIARSGQAESEFNRQRQMYDRGLIAQSEFERATTARVVAARDVDGARERLNQARNGARPEEILAAEARVESLRARVRDAEAALDDTVLRAPFDGVVGSVFVDNFQEAQAKQSILSFNNLGGLELELDVPEQLVLHRREGGEVRFEVAIAGLPDRRFPAQFRTLSSEANPQTRTYRARLGMERPDDVNIFPGMTAEVYAEATLPAAAEQALRVPVEAVGANSTGEATVWVVNAETRQVNPRNVTTGQIRGADIEILAGLAPGDTVVAAGLSQLRPGLAVRPLDN